MPIDRKFKRGDRVRCLYAWGYPLQLTVGRVYPVTKDEEAGIFADRPFVTVEGDSGDNIECHASRFALEIYDD